MLHWPLLRSSPGVEEANRIIRVPEDLVPVSPDDPQTMHCGTTKSETPQTLYFFRIQLPNNQRDDRCYALLVVSFISLTTKLFSTDTDRPCSHLYTRSLDFNCRHFITAVCCCSISEFVSATDPSRTLLYSQSKTLARDNKSPCVSTSFSSLQPILTSVHDKCVLCSSDKRLLPQSR